MHYVSASSIVQADQGKGIIGLEVSKVTLDNVTREYDATVCLKYQFQGGKGAK